MYRLMRVIHLCSALLLGVLIALYALSGFLMVNGSWFEDASKEVTRSVSFEPATRIEPGRELSRTELDALARQLGTNLGLSGRPERERPERRPDGAWIFRFGRPGTTEQVAVIPGDARATLVVRRHGLVTTLKGFHHVSGFAGPTKYDLWALAVDVVGLAMLLFPASGVYLWYQRRRRHPWGWLALGSGMVYVLGSLAFLLLRS